MQKPNVLVVGLGEVGHTIFEILKQSGSYTVYGLDIDKEKMEHLDQTKIPKTIDVLHICYRCFDQEKFVQATAQYLKAYKPKLAVINSTVVPGTTEKIIKLSNRHVVHSPVRGVHKTAESMKADLFYWTKYIGGKDKESAELAAKHFKSAGFKTKILPSYRETELAKLFETTTRAMLIAWYQEMHRISKHLNADFNEVTGFLEDTHRGRLDRPVLFPGVIGGHCLVPNAELLLKSSKSDFLELILKSNEQRKSEVKDKTILKEVEKIRQKAERLENWQLRLSGKEK